MNKSETLQQLSSNHDRFMKLVNSLSDSDFMYSNNGKWTAGQQLEHIIKSVRPVNLALALPGFLLRIAFGKANRPSKTYEVLIEKYHAKLAAGGKSSAPFIPKTVGLHQRERLLKKLRESTTSLIDRANSFSEKKLDSFILPHPLLGKLTLREMLYFTSYHVEHHQKQVVENLKPKQTTPATA
ncbi:MAG TPA: DinB family protein [Cyclobacteriaceae bacterium]|nr:DinB family protein [Cyclobacteriaceae bacterium]